MNVSGLGIITFVISITVAWLLLLLRKVRRFENRELVTKIKSEASDAIHDKSLDDLISDSESRRIRRDTKTKP